MTKTVTQRYAYVAWVSLACLGLACGALGEANYTQDGLGRTVLADYPGEGNDVRFAYWGDTGIVKMKEIGNGNKTILYNEAGDVKGVQYAKTPELNMQFTHYPDGSIKAISKGGVTTEYEYDTQGRVKVESTTVDGAETSIAYGYDSSGRVAMVYSGSSLIEYSYDESGRLISEAATYNTGRGISERKLMYVYDDLGKIARIIDTDTGDMVFAYAEAGGEVRLNSVEAGYYELDITYANDGSVFAYCMTGGGDDCMSPEKAYESGLLVSDSLFDYSYDSEKRLVKQVSKDPKRPLSLEYSYYRDGLLKDATMSNGRSNTYYYDAFGRLIKITRSVNGLTLDHYPMIPKEFDLNAAKNEFGSLPQETGAAVVGTPLSPSSTSGDDTRQPTDYMPWAIIAVIVLIIGTIIHSRRHGKV